jgi:hypothetical protein
VNPALSGSEADDKILQESVKTSEAVISSDSVNFPVLRLVLLSENISDFGG